jgi:hypothetical protein
MFLRYSQGEIVPLACLKLARCSIEVANGGACQAHGVAYVRELCDR